MDVEGMSLVHCSSDMRVLMNFQKQEQHFMDTGGTRISVFAGCNSIA